MTSAALQTAAFSKCVCFQITKQFISSSKKGLFRTRYARSREFLTQSSLFWTETGRNKSNQQIKKRQFWTQNVNMSSQEPKYRRRWFQKWRKITRNGKTTGSCDPVHFLKRSFSKSNNLIFIGVNWIPEIWKFFRAVIAYAPNRAARYNEGKAVIQREMQFLG